MLNINIIEAAGVLKRFSFKVKSPHAVGSFSRFTLVSSLCNVLAVHSIFQGRLETQSCERFQHPGPSVQSTLQVDQEDLNI